MQAFFYSNAKNFLFFCNFFLTINVTEKINMVIFCNYLKMNYV